MKTISHNAFVKKWVGKADDTDGGFGVQCVDLAKLYIRDVLGLPVRSFGGSAWMAWLNVANTFPASDWLRVKNERHSVVPRGAIVLYDADYSGGNGHVTIAHTSDEMNMSAIEQNGGSGKGKGEGTDKIRITEFKHYRKIVGWYVPIKTMKKLREPTLEEKQIIVMNRKLFGPDGNHLGPDDVVTMAMFAKNEYQNNEKFKKLVDKE